MTDRFLVDTGVLIDYLREVPQAIDFLENASEGLLVSAITVAELYAGVREGKECRALGAFLGAFEVIPLDLAVAERGGLFRRDYGRSHGTEWTSPALVDTGFRLPSEWGGLGSRRAASKCAAYRDESPTSRATWESGFSRSLARRTASSLKSAVIRRLRARTRVKAYDV